MKQSKKSSHQTIVACRATRKPFFKEEFGPIEDTPESVAKAILTTSLKEKEEI